MPSFHDLIQMCHISYTNLQIGHLFPTEIHLNSNCLLNFCFLFNVSTSDTSPSWGVRSSMPPSRLLEYECWKRRKSSEPQRIQVLSNLARLSIRLYKKKEFNIRLECQFLVGVWCWVTTDTCLQSQIIVSKQTWPESDIVVHVNLVERPTGLGPFAVHKKQHNTGEVNLKLSSCSETVHSPWRLSQIGKSFHW